MERTLQRDPTAQFTWLCSACRVRTTSGVITLISHITCGPKSGGRSIDDYNREGLGIEIDFSLPAERVIRSLEQIIEWRGKPKAIRCDNGPEYISGAVLSWAEKRGIRIDYIQPGKPQQNAYVERYNRTVRYDWLAQYLFDSIDEVQAYA